jgi:hypothetical protein
VSDNLEIKTKLTVDAGQSSSVLTGLKDQFNAVSSAQEATHATLGFFGTSLSMAAGTIIPQAIHKMVEFGHSFVDAARDEMAGQKSMAGMIATMQNIPWKHAVEQSAALSDEMDNIALSASRMPDDVKDAFSTMIEVGGATEASIESAKIHVGQLAQISRVLGTDTRSTAQEYQFMEEGILRTRGRMFQLLQTTGIFGDKTKGASAEWAKLTEAQRTDRLNRGLEQLSTRMADAPKGMGDMLHEFKAMEEMAKESLGMPLLNALTPQLKKLVEWMKTGRGSIEEFVKAMVVDVSQYADDAARVIREGWAYIRSNSKEIKDDIVTAWGYAKDVIQFAIEHKEAIAIAYGAKTVMGSGVAQQALGVGKAVYGAGAAGGVMQGAGGALGAGALGGAAALGAFALAIGAVALAATQGAKLMKEVDDDEKADTRARYNYFQTLVDKEKAGYAAMDQNAVDHFELTKHRFMIDSKLIGMSREEATRLADAAMAQHDANREMVKYAEDAARQIESAAKRNSGFTDEGEQSALVGKISGQFQNATNVLDSGAQAYIANILSKSAVLQRAFIESADMTSTGFTALAEATKDSAATFSQELKMLAETAAKKEKIAAGTPKVQFNGGQTFKIQQDFRDENPDRVATVFMRDVLAAAERRVQSATASPFGG